MATKEELQAEVDRLRLLLQRVTTNAKRKTRAMSVELEPAPHGFRMVVTGVSVHDEMEMAQMVGDCMNALVKGAVRWTVHAWDVYPTAEGDDKEKLHGTIRTLSVPEEHEIPTREEPETVDAAGQRSENPT